jgi:tRNA G18 (ribose-2'-O)-methylase SpoU
MSGRVPFRATHGAAAYAALPGLPARVLLDNVRSMYNVGSFFRTADGVRLDRLLLAGITARPPKPAITKTALGAEETVAWEAVADPRETVLALRRQGYEIASVETSLRSVDLFDWRPAFPVCLIFGHEVEGVSADLLEACDTHVRIPMLGVKHSLNVATAGGIVLYELLRKFRSLAEPPVS